MTTYTITFGKLGDTYPVPELTLTTDDDNEFVRTVETHAAPYLRPALEAAGCPEFADCIFRIGPDRTYGEFMWVDVVTGGGARFCGSRIEALS